MLMLKHRTFCSSRYAAWIFLVSGSLAVHIANAATLNVERSGRTLIVRGELPEQVQKGELRLRSSRNGSISRYTDISPKNPEPRD